MGTVLDPNRRPTPGSEGTIVSDEVERVFEKALAVDPRQRYADAGVFWNELLAAARITSGEVQEVRLPRDARAEAGGGTWVERVDVGRRSPSARPPSLQQPSPPAPALGGANQPHRPPAHLGVVASAAPELRSATPAPFPPAISGSFEVPDLDVAPMSRPAPQRTASGTRQAVAPALDLDEVTGNFGAGAPLDLDLPSNEPIARRISSGGMPAVRISEPPPPHSFRTPVPPPRSSYPPPERSMSPPPVALSAPTPPVSLRPEPAPLPSSTPASRGVEPTTVQGPERGWAPAQSGQRWSLKPSADATLVERLLPGGLVLGGAILVTILDQVYSAVSGEIFTIAGLRTSAVAGLFMVVGIALCLFRLIKRD
jgi:serine/threonine-protein kinase